MQYTIDTSPVGQLIDLVQHLGPASVALAVGALFIGRFIWRGIVR
jgi:hypothetical protein